MSKSRPKVAVIGAGYAGTAWCLAALRRGLEQRFDISLIEQSPDPGPVGAGVLLQPSGQYVLRQLGVFTPELESQLHPYRRLRARDGLNNVFLNLEVASSGYQTYGAHRGTVYEALLNPVKQAGLEGRLRLVFGHAVESAQSTGEGWSLFADGLDLGTYQLVIIADGNRSLSRERFGLRCLHRAYEIGALWYVGKSPEPSGELLQSCQGTSRILGLLPTDRSQSVSFFYSCSSDEYSRLVSAPFGAFVEQAASLAPESRTLLEQAGSFEEMLHTRYLHGWMPTWIGPGLAVVGDAAHPMSPHLGQGVNLALMDAYSLSKSLDELSVPEALKRYQRKRQGQVAINSWLSLMLTPFFQSQPDLGQGKLRNLGVRLFSAWPWMRKQMQGAVWGRKAELFDLVDDFEDIT